MRVSLFHKILPNFIRIPLAILFRKTGISTAIQSALCKREIKALKKSLKPTQTDHSSSKILIVCAHYNHLKWLPFCVDSVIQQNHSNWQLIIVDDASPDPSTHEALKSISAKDARIKAIVLEENSGAYIARNTALEAADSDWTHITFIDPDDQAHPTWLEHCLDILGNSEGTVRPVLQRFDESLAHLKSTYFGHCPSLHSRHAWERVGGFLPVRVSGDAELTARLYRLASDGTTTVLKSFLTAQLCRTIPGSASHQALRSRKLWLERRSASLATQPPDELRITPTTSPWRDCNP